MRSIIVLLAVLVSPAAFACGSTADVYNTNFKSITSADGTVLKSRYPSAADHNCNTKAMAPAATPAPVAVAPAATEIIAERFTFPFASNAKQPLSASLNQLPEIQKAIESGEFKAVKIVGFADQTGSVKYNNSLSFSRAMAIEKMLKGKVNSKVAMKSQGGGVKETSELDSARVVEVQLVK